MITKESLDMLGEAAQRYGLRQFKCGDYELTFTGEQPRLMVAAPDGRPTRPIGEVHGMPTDDELLFASSIPLSPEELEARPPHG